MVLKAHAVPSVLSLPPAEVEMSTLCCCVDSHPLELKSDNTFSSLSCLGGGVLCSSGTRANPASFGFKERFSKNSYPRK